MNVLEKNPTQRVKTTERARGVDALESPLSSEVSAKGTVASGEREPFLYANWERIVFLNFVADPELVRRQIPSGLELQLHEGKACVTLAAVTMRSFRPGRAISAGWLFRCIAEQRFLNLRTYVRCRGEPGVFFIWGWLSQPFGFRLPSGTLRLPYAFASLEYDHRMETGVIRGVVEAPATPAWRFAYRAAIDPSAPFRLCEPGSLAQFAMDRCTGFFAHRGGLRRFRGEHPLWLQAPIQARIEECSLVTARFPWFREVTLAGANFSPGFERVRLGLAHRVPGFPRDGRCSRSVLSSFFEMP